MKSLVSEAWDDGFREGSIAGGEVAEGFLARPPAPPYVRIESIAHLSSQEETPGYAGFDLSTQFSLHKGFSARQARAKGNQANGHEQCVDNEKVKHAVRCELRDDHCYSRLGIGGTCKDVVDQPRG